MKIKFSRVVEFTPTFNGNKELPLPEQFKVRLNVMSMWDFTTLVDNLQQITGSAGEVDASKLNMTQIKQLVESTGEYLPKYAEIVGLEDADGPVDAKAIVTYSAYFGLATEVLMELASISSPSDEEVKN